MERTVGLALLYPALLIAGPRIHPPFRSGQHAPSGEQCATFSSAVQQFPLPQGTTRHQASHQQHNEHHDGNKEQDASDISRCRGNAPETENRRHDRHDEKEQSQPQHEDIPFPEEKRTNIEQDQQKIAST
jgi:hypothetical protein